MTFWGGWKNSLIFLNNLSVDHIYTIGTMNALIYMMKWHVQDAEKQKNERVNRRKLANMKYSEKIQRRGALLNVFLHRNE